VATLRNHISDTKENKHILTENNCKKSTILYW